MRTKTLLLTAAALLAAGFVSTQAQPVYSQNIVGYATVPTPKSGTYYMLNIPFAMGVSNGANEVFGTTLPDFTLIFTWDVVHQSFVVSEYDSTQPTPGVSWYKGDDATPTIIPTLGTGQGFFMIPGGPLLTNTFAGTVAINVGTSNIMSLPNSGTYYMLGSVVPYAGAVSNGTALGGGINLNSLPDFSLVLTWDTVHQNYVVSEYDSTQPTPGVVWYQGDDATPQSPPSLSVGQGLFVIPGGPGYVWTEGL